MQRNNTPIILAAVLGVLGILGVALLFLGRGSGGTPPPAVAEIAQPTPTPSGYYVALRNIPPRTRITPELTELRLIDAEDAPEDAIRDLSELDGFITQKPIPAGAPIRRDALTEGVQRVIPANFEIPSGLRAVAVFVDPDSTAAGLVDIGDRVDVIATHRLDAIERPNTAVDGAKQFTAGRTIASNLLVLAVDRSLAAPIPTPTPEADAAVPDGAPPPPPPAPTPVPPPNSETRVRVILAASPTVASRLVAANDQGSLHVTIRNPADGDADLPAETREYPSRLVSTREANQQPRNNGRPVAPSAVGNDSGGNSGGGFARRNFEEPPLPPIKVEAPPAPEPPAPLPGPQGPQGPQGMPGPSPSFGPIAPAAPPAPVETEVTVIRGTEKTRVIVPER